MSLKNQLCLLFRFYKVLYQILIYTEKDTNEFVSIVIPKLDCQTQRVRKTYIYH